MRFRRYAWVTSNDISRVRKANPKIRVIRVDKATNQHHKAFPVARPGLSIVPQLQRSQSCFKGFVITVFYYATCCLGIGANLDTPARNTLWLNLGGSAQKTMRPFYEDEEDLRISFLLQKSAWTVTTVLTECRHGRRCFTQ